MFTVGTLTSISAQQVVVPFSQFASVVSTICSNSFRKTFASAKCKPVENVDCLQSFSEAVGNCTDPYILEWCDRELWKNMASLAPIVKRRRLESYISSSSFFENKYGFPESELNRSLSSPIYCCLQQKNRLLLQLHSIAGQQLRCGFKTRQQQAIEGQTAFKLPSLGNSLFQFRTRKDKKEKLISDMDQNKKLKTLLLDNNLSPEEQQRLRVAFAEGYLTSDHPRAPSKIQSFIKVFTNIVWLILFITIAFSVMGGPFRRVLIGSVNEVHPEEIDVSFQDVKGVDEAKQELQEIVEFLRNPEKFTVLGGKLPKGILLVGPPGTGKTLLARAIAGEAGVPFFHCAGSEFDEIFVGQGARRVRDLFRTAKAKAPCVIFIDEIDSVGAKRTNSVLHPYANQTINQLFIEMDGFRQNEGVIVLGATNRRDDLDKALLRPGRFDVEVQVPMPDLKGRIEIMKLYLGKVVVGSDVDLDVLGRGTTGFTGADLENMVNQAALKASIDGKEMVAMEYFEYARDKVLMGPERKSRVPDEEANLITAYHESGHALVSHYTKDSHPLHKVTIMPRGPCLGHTAYIPEKEQYHTTKSQMLATMDTMMGGRAAEELIFGADKITSGASSDLKKATMLATSMVKEWGMSDKMGLRTFEPNSLLSMNDLGASTAETMDSEIKRILTESFDRARSILRTHGKEHKMLAEALLKYETLDADDVKVIIQESRK